MERKKINVYTKLNNIEESYEIIAIKNDNAIKYIDLCNNIMIIDMSQDIIKRENNDYKFIIDFIKNEIDIYIKKYQKNVKKSIKTLLLKKNKKSYLVRYLLEDENTINEYYVKF